MNCPLCGAYGRGPVFGRCCEESIRFVEGELGRLARRNEDYRKNCPATAASVLVDAEWHTPPLSTWGCLELVEALVVLDDPRGVTVCWVPLGAKSPWTAGKCAEEVRLKQVWVFTRKWVVQSEGPEAPYERGKMFVLHIRREDLVPWPPMADSVAEMLAAEKRAAQEPPAPMPPAPTPREAQRKRKGARR